MSLLNQDRIRTEKIDDICVVELLTGEIVSVKNINETSNEIFDLFDRGENKIIVRFCNVNYVKIDFLAKLLFLLKRIKKASGRLVLCEIKKSASEVFITTGLNNVFNIAKDLESALALFSESE